MTSELWGEALEAMETLAAHCQVLRGEALQPAQFPEDDLRWCAPWAEALVSGPQSAAFAQKLMDQGAGPLWTLWDEVAQQRPDLARLGALLFWRWGALYAQRDNLAHAQLWWRRAWRWRAWVSVDVLRDCLGQGGRALSQEALFALGERWSGAWLEAHAEAAQENLEARRWPWVWLHWSMVISWGAQASDVARVCREKLTGALLEYLEALALASAARGVRSGARRAWELLVQANGVDPDNEALQRQTLRLGTRMAMEVHGQHQLLQFEVQAQALVPTLAWLRAHVAPEDASSDFRDVMAQALCCVAASVDDPAVALEALAQVSVWNPMHPTVASLYAQAQMAQSARMLGAGRPEEAWALFGQAQEELPSSAARSRLRQAILAHPQMAWVNQAQEES